MPEYTSEELQKLAKPALQHAELVRLARTETPSKAYELASTRWPRRQAKATRFLAMLRRDHGQRAFEVLITQTEHAQGGNIMVTLESLYPDGIRNVVFAPRAYTPDQLVIWFFVNDEQTTKKVNFQEEVNRLKLDSKQTQTLVRRIINAMLAQWATPKVKQFSYGGIWASAALAMRTYLPEDRKYYRKILAATIVYHGGCSKDPVGLLTAVISQEELAKVEQTDEDKNRLSGLMPDKSLQLVIDHALKYFTTEELKDLWRQMLQMRMRENFVTVCIVEWWKNLEIDGKYLNNCGGVVEKTAQQCLVRDLRNLLFEDEGSGHYLKITYEDYFDMLEGLASTCWDWCRSEQGQEWFEDVLINCLARGQAAKASIVLARFGRYFNFCSFEPTLSERVKFEESLHRSIRGAIELALENKNFGIACALAEYIGEHERADELRQKARHYEQKIALDFTFYTRAH